MVLQRVALMVALMVASMVEWMDSNWVDKKVVDSDAPLEHKWVKQRAVSTVYLTAALSVHSRVDW